MANDINPDQPHPDQPEHDELRSNIDNNDNEDDNGTKRVRFTHDERSKILNYMKPIGLSNPNLVKMLSTFTNIKEKFDLIYMKYNGSCKMAMFRNLVNQWC